MDQLFWEKCNGSCRNCHELELVHGTKTKWFRLTAARTFVLPCLIHNQRTESRLSGEPAVLNTTMILQWADLPKQGHGYVVHHNVFLLDVFQQRRSDESWMKRVSRHPCSCANYNRCRKKIIQLDCWWLHPWIQEKRKRNGHTPTPRKKCRSGTNLFLVKMYSSWLSFWSILNKTEKFTQKEWQTFQSPRQFPRVQNIEEFACHIATPLRKLEAVFTFFLKTKFPIAKENRISYVFRWKKWVAETQVCVHVAVMKMFLNFSLVNVGIYFTGSTETRTHFLPGQNFNQHQNSFSP